jgi:hypothetical protein
MSWVATTWNLGGSRAAARMGGIAATGNLSGLGTAAGVSWVAAARDLSWGRAAARVGRVATTGDFSDAVGSRRRSLRGICSIGSGEKEDSGQVRELHCYCFRKIVVEKPSILTVKVCDSLKERLGCENECEVAQQLRSLQPNESRRCCIYKRNTLARSSTELGIPQNHNPILSFTRTLR